MPYRKGFKLSCPCNQITLREVISKAHFCLYQIGVRTAIETACKVVQITRPFYSENMIVFRGVNNEVTNLIIERIGRIVLQTFICKPQRKNADTAVSQFSSSILCQSPTPFSTAVVDKGIIIILPY